MTPRTPATHSSRRMCHPRFTSLSMSTSIFVSLSVSSLCINLLITVFPFFLMSRGAVC